MAIYDRHADLQAVIDDAYKRGVEAAAKACDDIGRDWRANGQNEKRFAAEYLANWIRSTVRIQPEPKT